MKVLLLRDENGFGENDENFLTKMGYGTALTIQRMPFYMAVNYGSGIVPALYFNSPEEEDLFFNDIDRKGSVTVFTTLSNNLLVHFNEQFFLDTKKMFKIKCRQVGRHQDFAIYSNRLIEFVKETRSPVDKHPETILKHQLDDSVTLYRAYFNPVMIDIPEADLYPFYENLFKNKNSFPLALPAGRPATERSYFGDHIENNLNVSRIKIREIVRSFTKEIADRKDLGCLFFQLWEMTDHPIISEYLKEGSFFSFHSNPVGKPDTLQGQEMDGTMFISFNYPDETLYPDDVLIRWHSGLLMVSDEKDEIEEAGEINNIKKALLSDIRAAIPGGNTRIVPTKKELNAGWDRIRQESFDTSRSRGLDGPWTDIEKFQQEIIRNRDRIKEYSVLHDFITSAILNISERQGNIAHDHVLALTLFSEYICKFPFIDVQSASQRAGNNILPEVKDEWQKFCFDFISTLWGLFPHRKRAELELVDGYYTYNEPLMPKDIFVKRLSLAHNVVLRSGFSSILDFQNSLNNNFIL